MFYTNREKPVFITYPAEEKSRMDRIYEVFRPIMEASGTFHIVRLDKLGYVFFTLDGEYCKDGYGARTVSDAEELGHLIILNIMTELMCSTDECEFTPECEKLTYEVLAPCLAQLPEFIEFTEDCVLMDKAQYQYHIDLYDYDDDSWKELIPDISAVKAALRAACPEI